MSDIGKYTPEELKLVNSSDAVDLDLLDGMKEYTSRMAKNNIVSKEEIIRYQSMLYNLFTLALKAPKDDFARRQLIILHFLNKGIVDPKGAFTDSLPFRAINELPSRVNVDAFHLMLGFYRDIGKKVTRPHALRNVNMKAITRMIPKKSRDLFLSFYGSQIQ